MKKTITKRQVYKILNNIYFSSNEQRNISDEIYDFNGIEDIINPDKKKAFIEELKEFHTKYKNELFEICKDWGYVNIQGCGNFDNVEDIEHSAYVYKLNHNGKNFIKHYKKIQYLYDDNTFLGSLMLGFLGGIVGVLTTEGLKFLIKIISNY